MLRMRNVAWIPRRNAAFDSMICGAKLTCRGRPAQIPGTPAQKRRARLIPQANRTTPAIAEKAKPDLILSPGTNLSMPEIHVFGVDHSLPLRHVADYVWSERPRAVLVESALDEQHEQHLGNSIMYQEDILRGGTPGTGWRYKLTRLAWRLRQEDCLPGTGRTCDLWESLSCQLASEMLVYVAALAADIPIIYCDRPKMVTYRRLLHESSLVELDHAFGVHCALNYMGFLETNGVSMEDVDPRLCPGPTNVQSMTTRAHEGKAQLAEEDDVFSRIVIQERNKLLAHSFASQMCRDACQNSHAEAGACMVGVVGRDHLYGISECWASEPELNLLSTRDLTELLSTSDRGHDEQGTQMFAAKLALFERLLLLKCSRQVVAHAFRSLGGVSPEAKETYETVHELYGTCRMMLAVLPPALLRAVVSDRECDMHQLLEPLRALRPIHGGNIVDVDAVRVLRTLNFLLE